MRIGIVLHGPEIIDVGGTKRIIEAFMKEHEVVAKLGGTMGRTAVLDAGLEDIIDISQGLTPSETINGLKDSIDIAILLNHGKTLETGRHFGRIVASKLASPLRFVQVERPDSDGRIIYYSPGAKRCAEYVKKFLARYGNYDLPLEQGIPLPLCVRNEGGAVIRHICGAFPGEHIRLDGIIIGEITGAEPEIVCREGTVVGLRGGKIKPHGLEKLKNRKIDLFTARVKTGHSRRTKHMRKVKTLSSEPLKTAAMIDHCAESTFELVRDAGVVVTVGDDTTAIAADILTRLGIPVIGITDGDLDCILEDTEIPKGSAIIRVREGFDDVVGKEVLEKLMKGKQKLYRQNSEKLLAGILALAGKYLVETRYY